jgi:hypothetical protein
VRSGQRGWRAVAAVVLAFQVQLAADGGGAQSAEQSPSDLISFLTYQAGRTDTHGLTRGVFNCGAANAEAREDRPATEALVKMGTRAIPEIEAAFQSIEAYGQQSPFAFNSALLLSAYARIRGRDAYSRLRSMLRNPRLAFLQRGIDSAVAISLGTTSYVSDSRQLADTAVCGGVLEPRDLLDQLLAAWQRNDRHWVEGSLGPAAMGALSSSLQEATWEGQRAKLWGSNPGVGDAVGYRFVTAGWWSAPEEHLEMKISQRTPANPLIDTQFTNRSGRDCGSYRVKFSRAEEFYVKYLIDNPDLAGLLRLIAACAISP